MSRGPIHPWTALQWLLVAALVLGLALVVFHLRRSAPYAPIEFLLEGAEDPRDPAADIVTCERSLPELPADPEGNPDVTPIGRVTSSAVIECPTEFDGHVVVYVGEVIGDVLHRPDGAWVLMNDDTYALETGPLRSHGRLAGYNSGLSVWLDGDLADLANEAGGPDHRGDVLRVRGIVHRTDPADGGGLTIRAFDGEVLAQGQAIAVPLHRAQVVVAVLLGVAAAVLLVAERRTRQRR